MDWHRLGAAARVKITVDITGDLLQHIGGLAPLIFDAANRAVERQSGETQQAMRTEITQGLSARAANAYRRKKIVNPNQQVVGFLYSAWRRKPRSGGQDIDMFAAFEQGAIIRPVRGKFLAMALPAAYAVAGGRDGKKRPTIQSVETALDQDLFMVHRPGHVPILAAKNVSLGGGRRQMIRTPRFRNRRGTLSRRRTVNAIFPMFLLLRNVRLPRRLDFSRIEEDGAKGLDDKFIVEMAGRGVFS